jgi:DNA-binding GntR family transcriptional regulator
MTSSSDIIQLDASALRGERRRADETTLHDKIVAQLREILMHNELESGTKIPEADLCQRFGVSRTPLREALKVMAAEGFVQLIPNRGAVVAPIDLDEIAPLFEMKGAFERLIGLTVPGRITAEDMTILEQIHASLGSALEVGNHTEYTRLNYLFHRRLSLASANPLLIPQYENLQKRLWRYRYISNESQQRLQRSYGEHESIMVALRARTPLDLAWRLEEHNRVSGDSMIEALKSVAASARKGPGIKGLG